MRLEIQFVNWEEYLKSKVLRTATQLYASLTLWRIYGEWAYECSSP